MKLEKLGSAALKVGGAIACGVGTYAVLVVAGSTPISDGALAVGAGLATSTAILGAQAVKDVVDAFRQD